MSVIQLEELVSYQLRTSYLDEIADGVGERLLTVNDNFLNSAAFKAAGWRPNSSHIKRTHSPPIPTAIASEYFQAPRQQGLTLEDGEDDGGMLTGGGADTMGPGMATKRRRRREQMEEDDSSDLTDESDEEHDQRAAQQIKFSKMPVRQRAGSSPSQVSPVKLQTSPRVPRRGSQSALETVRERPRRDTVTSSEISSENEFDVPAAQRHREAARAAARAMRLQDKINEEPIPGGLQRADTQLLPEEEDDDSDEGSDISADYVGSMDSASILDGVENPINPSPTQQVVGTPPRNFPRQSMIRKSQLPVKPVVLEALPPPRPMSMIRPASVVQPTSLLSAALKAKEHKSSVPFQKFAHYSGQGTQGSIAVRIYAPFCKTASQPFEVLIRPRVHDGQGAERVVSVTDLIGLSLYRYNEEKREPQIPPRKFSVNWWTLRMVEDGEVDDDFPPFERTKPLTSFTTVNNASARGGGRMRSNSTAYDEFALVPASEDEYEENKRLTPQQDDNEAEQGQQAAPPLSRAKSHDDDPTPKNTPAPPRNPLTETSRPRQNPIVTTTYRPNTPLADTPQVPVTVPNTTRGQQKLLRVHIMSSDVAPGQMVTVDVTTDTYLAEVLDIVCRKRQLDKANHVLKLPRSGAVVMIDRPVSSIGNVSDLELYRRRFATDGPLSMTGSPSSSSPKTMGLPSSQGVSQRRENKREKMLGPHPLAQEALKQDEFGNANYKKYTVWRKQPMRLVGMSERILVIDGEYIHIVPASGGKAVHDGGGKTTTVHFSNVVGCKVPRKHPTNVKLVIYKATESKRYDFEARGADEAAEIVAALKKGISPYREV
ncbi:stress activated MAP kinase interacting protein Sin1 [Pochonia chlamydosporia 170]|uniref:Stress activated MAP kinase interacting protein Sin1 n=1 Tax=Pochonia chlamydosporia 170 TaxID=1380566 RepID=A0A179FSC5_METCM|nr:stress activated MAP kinase interacting protein Sin1 [Pochonia chlamydosporia 170]OAQ68158.1 stress activated MAP kinase interacting protein Sin1 [Pochonia chlamydosporia 170]